MSWKDIIKAQLAILDREDARDLMRQYRGEQAKALGKNIALIQQNLPDVVKEFKIMMDNPVKGYDGIPSYNTVDATANIILVIDYQQMNRNIKSNKFGGYNESYYGLDNTLLELFRGNSASFRNPLSSTSEGGVRQRKRKDTYTEKGEIQSYQKTFPFKVEFDASKPMLFGAEKLIDFLDELEDLLDREVRPIKKQDYNEDDFFMTEEAVEGKVGEKIQEMYSMAEELSKMQNILNSPDFQRGFPKYSLKEIEKAVKGLGMAVSAMESFPS